MFGLTPDPYCLAGPSDGQLAMPPDMLGAAAGLSDPIGAAAAARGQPQQPLSPLSQVLLLALTDGGQLPLEQVGGDKIMQALSQLSGGAGGGPGGPLMSTPGPAMMPGMAPPMTPPMPPMM